LTQASLSRTPYHDISIPLKKRLRGKDYCVEVLRIAQRSTSSLRDANIILAMAEREPERERGKQPSRLLNLNKAKKKQKDMYAGIDG
jgi:hypothetical protein